MRISLLWLIPESPQKWRVWRRQLSLKHYLGTFPGTAPVEESHERETPKVEVTLGCSSMHGLCLWVSGVACGSRLFSLNQKTFALFLVEKIGWTYPIPHFPFGKGKNFPTELFEPLYHYWQMAIWEFYTWQPEGWWGTSGHLCISVVLR